MVKRLNNPILALLTLAGFIWLAWYSLNHKAMASNEEAQAFIEQKLAEYSKPVEMNQVQALYSVWNLTEADVAKPVDLFNEGEKL